MKAKVIIIGTGYTNKRFILENNDSQYIEIIGIIPDESVDEIIRKRFIEDINSALDKKINVFSFSDACLNKADLLFALEYRRIIPVDICESYVIVNCHAGILPKWRGFSANAWAIMNGENHIGYSIHRVRSGVDDGEVYHINKLFIEKNQTYGDVHGMMVDSIISDVPEILYQISSNIIKPIEQSSEGIAYCNRFTVSMGNITGFINNSEYYVNLYRCMAKPLGSGLWFEYKEKKYYVKRIEHGKMYGVIDYYGVPGKIVNIKDNKLWVKTKDNIVILSGVEMNGCDICLSDEFKNGNLIS